VEVTRIARTRAAKGEGAATAFQESIIRSPRRAGAYLAHFGLIVTVIAIAVSSVYKQDTEFMVAPGEVVELGNYTLTYEGLDEVPLPHLLSKRARVRVNGSDLVLQPALNSYPRMSSPIGTPAVRTHITHDLYLTLMSVGDSSGRIGLRVIITPMVVWVWIGVIILTMGTFLCLVPATRRKP